jgi:hypothetical protein
LPVAGKQPTMFACPPREFNTDLVHVLAAVRVDTHRGCYVDGFDFQRSTGCWNATGHNRCGATAPAGIALPFGHLGGGKPLRAGFDTVRIVAGPGFALAKCLLSG